MSITLIIIITTCIVSYLALNNKALQDKLLLKPYNVYHNKEYYRMITSGFVHGSWLHLGINMFVLYSFGGLIEQNFESQSLFGIYGKILFLVMYIFCIIVADMMTVKNNHKNYNYGSLGASGAVSGVIFVFVLFYPWEKIYLYGIIGIPSIIAAIAYLFYSSWAAKNKNDNTNHDAHFYGAIAGVVFTLMLKPSLYMSFIHQLLHQCPYFDF